MQQKSILVILGFFLSASLFAQSPSPEFESGYQTAKVLMSQGKYGLATQSFKKLLANPDERNELVPYATYYMAYAAYESGDKSFAKDAFLQITIKHENWNKIDAANLWLAKIGFEQSGPFKGMLYASKITNEPYLTQSKKFIEVSLKKEPVETLQSLYEEYPQNEIVAMAYATALSKLPNSFETSEILNQLIEKFGFDSAKFNSIPVSQRKDHYDIGIVLPLFIDRIEATGKYLNKSLAIDIYEGAKMAAKDVDSTMFMLHVFDSKKDSMVMEQLFEAGELKNMDAVLGPLYPGPVDQMIQYASKEKVNFVNPTSSNPQISNSSPYAFLSRAGADDLGLKAADYMKSQPVNKNLIIYYGTSETDSISAFVYKQEMEADSFNVVSVQRIGAENRRQVYDGLTASVTIADKEKIAKMTREQIQNSIQLPTMDSLLIQPDSIGHIFISSSNLTVATEAMSAIISRRDSIKIMGVGNWFEADNAGLSIMEGLGVTLAISAFDDVSSAQHTLLTERYMKLYKSKPSKYFFRGYFAMQFIAESLKAYGTYFQNGYHTSGNFNELMDFEYSNKNGAIYIIKMIENQIQKLEPGASEGSDEIDSSKY